MTGHDPRPWFRSPFGDLDARTIRIVNSLGYGSIFWAVGTQGYLGTSGGQSVSTVVARVLGGLQPGEIVILEVQANATDHSTLDADALPTIIREVQQRGYRFVSLDQFIKVTTQVPPLWQEFARAARESTTLRALPGRTRMCSIRSGRSTRPRSCGCGPPLRPRLSN